MILLIGGIFIGLLTILSGFSWLSVLFGLWAVALIAAGIQQLVNGRPEPPTPYEIQQLHLKMTQRTDADSAGIGHTRQSKTD